MARMKRIRTVLYGDQPVSPAELEILHTPSLQRLYGLHQLGMTDRVFIDASHSRLHHVVGVLAQVDKLVSSTAKNLRRRPRPFKIGKALDSTIIEGRDLAREVERKRPVIRFIGLLHDLTHAPFGHTVEDEIKLVDSQHDEPQRQAEAFLLLVCQLAAWLSSEAGIIDRAAGTASDLSRFLAGGSDCEPPSPQRFAGILATLLSPDMPKEAAAAWRLTQRELATMLAQLDAAMTALLHLEALHKSSPEPHHLPATTEYPFQAVLRRGLAATPFSDLTPRWTFNPHRDAYMLDIVGNTVCADLLDYAKRDSHFAGLQLAYDPDRIAENFTLVTWDASAYELANTGERRTPPPGHEDPFEGWCLRTAISLFSHKYRTDVPGELMNLLTARFHLYERAIYHPTKCAAGAMLGTALQMAGWRRAVDGRAPKLPDHLRHVGDDVFLHDLRASLRLLIEKLQGWEGDAALDDSHGSSVAALDAAHNGLVGHLLRQRIGVPIAEALGEFQASAAILDRIAARRFARPVFRALPSSHDLKLEMGAAGLAHTFLNPDIRYAAEREIEKIAALRPGSVFIHCPRRATAEKIANVLLVRRGQSDDEICKLRDISRLDAEVFGKHESAIKAVEQMYRSMWRLVVYVVPEYMHMHTEVSNAAGQVLFRRLDVHEHYGGLAEHRWQNDRHLVAELEEKADGADGRYFGESVTAAAEAFEELINSGTVPALDALMTRVDRERLTFTDVKGALESLLTTGSAQATDVGEFQNLLSTVDTYFDKPLAGRRLRGFKRRYEVPWGVMSAAAREDVVAQLERSIRGTPSVLEQNQGTKLKELLDALDRVLRKHGVVIDRGTGMDEMVIGYRVNVERPVRERQSASVRGAGA